MKILLMIFILIRMVSIFAVSCIGNEPERVAELLICYKESILDSLLDNFAEMWDLKKAR